MKGLWLLKSSRERERREGGVRERQVVAMMIRADSVLAGKTKGRLLSNTVGWLAQIRLLHYRVFITGKLKSKD